MHSVNYLTSKMATNVCNLSVNSILACAVCTELYNEKELRPKLLQCGHTFCLRCLTEILKGASEQSSDNRDSKLSCPSCRQETSLSSLSAMDLADNFAIIECLSSAKGANEACCYCEKHPDERIKFFCMPCHRLLCPCCALKHMSQNIHNVVKVEAAALKYKQKIQEALDYCKEKRHLLEKIVQESLNEKKQLSVFTLSLEHLRKNISDTELLTQKETLIQLDKCISRKQIPDQTQSSKLEHIAQKMERRNDPTPPGFWDASSSEDNDSSTRNYHQENTNFSCRNVSEMLSNRRTQGCLLNPIGVAVTDDGFVFVTDKSDERVKVFDYSMELLWHFSKPEQPKYNKPCFPAGIAISSLGYLVAIAEPIKQQVSVHARDGRKIFSLKQDWQCPFGVAVNTKGQIVVTDKCECGSFYILTVDWTCGNIFQIKVIDGLYQPSFVACSKTDDIVITTSNSVKVFDVTGSLRLTINHELGSNQFLHSPKGVAFDNKNNIIVSDYYSGKVVLLNSEGKWLMDIISGLQGPQGITVTPNSLLVITESLSHNISFLTRMRKY
uniref:RING-type E3 ubiquitin transferase n=1 Tax=Erpetoichthys calabaricus TaxID=27687 RepID=A0A8C4X305_ERPCA